MERSKLVTKEYQKEVAKVIAEAVVNLSLIHILMKLFVGTHDFRNFVSGPRIDYTTTIYKPCLLYTSRCV